MSIFVHSFAELCHQPTCILLGFRNFASFVARCNMLLFNLLDLLVLVVCHQCLYLIAAGSYALLHLSFSRCYLTRL